MTLFTSLKSPHTLFLIGISLFFAGLTGPLSGQSDHGSWSPMELETLDENLQSVFFVNDSTGLVVGDEGVIIHTKDGGFNWEHQGPEPVLKFVDNLKFTPEISCQLTFSPVLT